MLELFFLEQASDLLLLPYCLKSFTLQEALKLLRECRALQCFEQAVKACEELLVGQGKHADADLQQVPVPVDDERVEGIH